MNMHFLLAGGLLAALLGSTAGHDIASPNTQYGAHPVLPAPHQYLLPPMRVPPGVGWSEGKTPAVPAGLQIQAFATGFEHPRMVYALPNGDVLVVESNGPAAPIYREIPRGSQATIGPCSWAAIWSVKNSGISLRSRVAE